MHNLKIDKNENIFFDDKEINRKDLSPDFLENIMIYSLKKEIEFELDESANLSYLFKRIKEETEENTDFYLKWLESKKKYNDAVKEREKIVSNDNAIQ